MIAHQPRHGRCQRCAATLDGVIAVQVTVDGLVNTTARLCVRCCRHVVDTVAAALRPVGDAAA